MRSSDRHTNAQTAKIDWDTVDKRDNSNRVGVGQSACFDIPGDPLFEKTWWGIYRRKSGREGYNSERFYSFSKVELLIQICQRSNSLIKIKSFN